MSQDPCFGIDQSYYHVFIRRFGLTFLLCIVLNETLFDLNYLISGLLEFVLDLIDPIFYLRSLHSTIWENKVNE